MKDTLQMKKVIDIIDYEKNMIDQDVYMYVRIDIQIGKFIEKQKNLIQVNQINVCER